MTQLTIATNPPDPVAALRALLERAERDVATQREAYGTEQDEDRAWRCAWNSWRTLREIIPAVRALLDQPTQPPSAPARHLHAVQDAA